jgi:hypothetical protein
MEKAIEVLKRELSYKKRQFKMYKEANISTVGIEKAIHALKYSINYLTNYTLK